MDKARLGKEIKTRRKAKGLNSIEDMEHASGLGYVTIQEAETGKGNPTLETLTTIADTLKTPLSDLIKTAESKELRPLPDLFLVAKAISGLAVLPEPQQRFVFALCLKDESYIATQPELAPLLPMLRALLKLP